MSDESKNVPQVAIDQQVIDDALQSVQRREEQPPTESTDVPTNSVVAVDELNEEIRSLREALRQREAELEASQAMGRETTARLKETHDRLLRTAADHENYKRRVQKEKEEISRFGNEKLLKELLPVLDNLDRALEHAKSPSDFEGLLTGIQMTRKMFEDALARFGVKGFSALGQPFDPNLHEAMQLVESDSPPNTVVQEYVRGYTLNDRLVRPAMVVVAKAREEQSESTAAEAVSDAPAEEIPPEASAEATASADAPTERLDVAEMQQQAAQAATGEGEIDAKEAETPSAPSSAAESPDARGAEDAKAEESGI